jgi:sodium-dependent dicarboxylate transporter 2/3/5
MLFLGGFFLAMAATRYQLDINLARVLLKPFGSQPKYVLLGLMIITALFSMFMSNTATTAMMLAILFPVLGSFDKSDRGRIAFLLGIPFAANIGGIGTPIGTPPNAIALKYLTGENIISFGTWMRFAVPFAAIVLVFAWLLLLWFFKPRSQPLTINITGKFRKNWKAITVYATFGITIFLWLFDFLHGMNAYIVAMLPVSIFTVTRIISAEDLKKISWDVLWLLSGGIALGTGLEKSGLALHIIESIPFAQFSPYFILFLATLLTLLMASFMSHTATANLLLPIMATLGTTIPSMVKFGGSKLIILAVTFSASLAMSFAVSTPPNAMAHATGEIKSSSMFRTGSIIGLFGLFCLYLLLFILKKVHFL